MTPKQEARLIGRAMKERWETSAEQRVICIDTLVAMVATRDPKQVEVGMNYLLKADAINVKMTEMELKQKTNDDDQRLRLLEIAKHVPIADLARIASDHSITGTSTVVQ